MIKFNEDHFHLLEPYEDKLRKAQKGYATGMTKTIRDTVVSVYREVIGGNLNRNCDSCMLKMTKGVANIYFKYKEDYEQRSIDTQRRTDSSDVEGLPTDKFGGGNV